MSTKTTVALALAAGFIGGIASQRIIPTPARAQEQASVPQEIRPHRFVLVNDAGVDLGVFGIKVYKGDEYAGIEMMDTKGYTSGPRMWPVSNRYPTFLPDSTCPACPRKRPMKGITIGPPSGTLAR
jgi:hypothetical protein